MASSKDQNAAVWRAVLEKLHEIRSHELEVVADDFGDLQELGTGSEVTLRPGNPVRRRQNKRLRRNVQEGIVRRPPIDPAVARLQDIKGIGLG